MYVCREQLQQKRRRENVLSGRRAEHRFENSGIRHWHQHSPRRTQLARVVHTTLAGFHPRGIGNPESEHICAPAKGIQKAPAKRQAFRPALSAHPQPSEFVPLLRSYTGPPLLGLTARPRLLHGQGRCGAHSGVDGVSAVGKRKKEGGCLFGFLFGFLLDAATNK